MTYWGFIDITLPDKNSGNTHTHTVARQCYRCSPGQKPSLSVERVIVFIFLYLVLLDWQFQMQDCLWKHHLAHLASCGAPSSHQPLGSAVGHAQPVSTEVKLGSFLILGFYAWTTRVRAVLPRALALTQVHSDCVFGRWVWWLRPSTWSIFTWGTFCAGWLHLRWIPCIMQDCVMALCHLTAPSILAQGCSWALFCPGKWLPRMPAYSSWTLLCGRDTKHQEESSALSLLGARLWLLFDVSSMGPLDAAQMNTFRLKCETLLQELCLF